MRQKQILWGALILYFLFAGHVFSEDNVAEVESPPIVSKIIVEIDEARGDKAKWVEMAKKLIFLREGEPLSTERFQETLEALKVCKKFQNIHADASDGTEEITITFQLTPFRQIKDIKINDASPLFEREILNVMTIYIGDAFVQEELSKQKTLIEKIFQNEGFVDPKVEVTAKEDPEDGYFTVYVNIERGDYFSVRNLEIEGNKAFSNARLKLRMKTWTASLLPRGPGRFIEKNLREDVKNLTEYYREKGYPDAVIDSKIEKDPETKGVSVAVIIKEGNEYDVEFEGNEEFWDLTLKKDLVLFKEGNRNNFGIRKSVRNIKDHYRKAGYLKADVNVEDEIKDDEAVRMLCFVIDEGPQSLVESIQIKGNHLFDEKKIKKQMLTQLPGILANGAFVPEVLKEDMNAVISLYFNQGYKNTKVEKDVKWSEDRQKVSVRLDISEGVQTLVSSVSLPESGILSSEEMRDIIQVKVKTPFLKSLVQEDEKSLASVISEKGYPHVDVKGEISIKEDQSEAAVKYNVTEGPYVKMGEVYLTGNFRTEKRIVLNELEIEPEAPFSLVKLLEAQRNIRNMNIFDSVQFKAIGLKEKSDEIHLFVEMEEKKPYFVEVGMGYDTERSFFAHAKSGDRNLFGTNKSAWLSGEVSQIGYRGEFGITEPRLFGSRISSTFGLFAEEKEELNQDFGIRSFGSSLGFSRKWLKKLNTSLNFHFEQRDQFRTDTGKSLICDVSQEECETRRIFVTTPSISYDTRDSFVRPTKGVFSSASVAVSQGLESSLDTFLKYQADARFYWSPVNRLTFAWHGRGGYIYPFGSSERVAKDQLFFLGGTSDVRGFKENMLRFDADEKSLGGQTSILGSMEARIDLGLNFEFTTFYDVGKLADTFEKSNSSELRSAAGVGLRYITPIGPIGFLYGVKLGKEEGESAGRLHFSLGYTF